MSALEDWNEVRYDSLDIEAVHAAADAMRDELLAELAALKAQRDDYHQTLLRRHADLAKEQAEVERLKCCGNCRNLSVGQTECDWDGLHIYDMSRHCRITPSRWTQCEPQP